jgi:uncharacterized protein
VGDARITVSIGADGLSAVARVTAGPVAAEPELEAALQAAGVLHGISRTACEALAMRLADELFAVEAVAIAEGLRPEPGVDGYFVPAFAAGIQPGRMREDGTMDFRDRELLKPLASGAPVGRLHPAQPGTPGRRVDGGELPVAKVRECTIALGPGVRLLEDGALVAARAGVLLYVANKSVDVVQHHVHTGNVDLRSGHLDMEGSLLVRGNVERPFRASASGDVEVQGGVECGSVHAEGSVRVTSGVRGGEAGMLSAGGDVSARHAEHAHVVCEGLLKLESSVNSALFARDIQVTGKLRGGKACAERSVVAGEAGVAHGADTTLAVAVPLEQPVLDAKRAVDTAKEQRSLQPRSLRSDGRAKGGKIGRAAATLANTELERKIALAQRREALLGDAYIEVTGTLHPGVAVRVGTATLVLEESTACARFSFDPETRTIRAERFVR